MSRRNERLPHALATMAALLSAWLVFIGLCFEEPSDWTTRLLLAVVSVAVGHAIGRVGLRIQYGHWRWR